MSWNTKKASVLLGAFLLGSALYFWVHRPPVIPEQAGTDRRVEEIRENYRRSVERGETVVKKTERKVVTIRERAVEVVRRVSDDVVVGILNAELVLWRMENGSGGVGDP